MRKTELLMPAGSLEVLKTAVIYGADAVYAGGEAFGLRAKARNFTMEELKEGAAFAHRRGAKLYITANILAHNQDLEEAEGYFEELKQVEPDALIISDPGMFVLARRVLPETDIHISTQANNTNYGTYRFWHELGAKRVVSARELSLREIGEIRRRIPEDMEIESFVHGAMCISYSGRCLLSNYFTGRDANQGACTHPCRWNYAVVEETRPGEYMPVYENERGTFLFNSKDLCMIEHIPELLEAGIDSFKVEGRMKTALYVGYGGPGLPEGHRRFPGGSGAVPEEPGMVQGGDWKMHQPGVYHRLLFWKAGQRQPDLRQQHLCEGLHLPGDGRGEGRKGPGAAGTEEQIFRGGDHRGDEAGWKKPAGPGTGHIQ